MSPDTACDVLVFRDDDIGVGLQCFLNGVRFIEPWPTIETSTVLHRGPRFAQTVTDRFGIVEIHEIIIARDFILSPAEHLAKKDFQYAPPSDRIHQPHVIPVKILYLGCRAVFQQAAHGKAILNMVHKLGHRIPLLVFLA